MMGEKTPGIVSTWRKSRCWSKTSRKG